MNRKELAGMLEHAADLMEVLGEGEFRALSYRKAARNLEKIETGLEALAAENFAGIPGVGKSLAPMLSEIVQTGEFPYLSELEGRVPPGVQEFFRVQGLGPKRIRALWENGVDSLEELIRRAEEGRLRSIPGFGAKTEAGLAEAARFALEGLRRVHLPVGLEAAKLLLADLAAFGIQAELSGSLRRGLETIGNVDLVALAEPSAVVKALGGYLELSEGNIVFGRLEGLPLKIFCADSKNYGTVLATSTGAPAFLENLGPLPPASDEVSLFRLLARSYVPPYWREIEHMGLEPPSELINQDDLLGLIHCHTTYSDGTASLGQMAEAAIARGYQYMVLSDHSQSAPYAGGLKPADLERQWAEADKLNSELTPFRILKSIESDILPDGSLDYPEEILSRFDLVIGSLHSGFTLSREEQTARLLRAIENPYLSILGHASGRLLLRRKGVDADWERILDRAAERGVIIEFNCNPYRLDLDWRLMLTYRQRLKFSLGPDAHNLEGMEDVSYGLMFARKAGLAKKDLVNTWTANQLLQKRR